MVCHCSAKQCLMRQCDDDGTDRLQRSNRDKPTIRIGSWGAPIRQVQRHLIPGQDTSRNECLRDSQATIKARIDESFDVKFMVRILEIAQSHMD